MEASGGPWAAVSLYNRDPALQQAVGPLGLSGAVYGDPTVLNGIANDSLQPNGYFVVTASFVWESVFAGIHVNFWPTWTRYALL
jgi:hypothetical protein